MADFTQELGSAEAELAKIAPEVQRIATDSDADASPQKNAKDINTLAMAISFLVAAMTEMAKQHMTMREGMKGITGETEQPVE